MSNENPDVGGAVPEPHLTGDGHRAETAGALPPPQHAGTPQHPGAPQHPGTPEQFAPPQHVGTAHEGAAPQHVGTAHEAAAPQHAGSVHEGAAPQHAGTVHQGAAPQHAGSPLQPPQPPGAQAVEHAASSPHAGAAQHAPGPDGGLDPAAAQHTGTPLQSGRGGRWQQLKTLRHARPRLYMGAVGGAAAAAVAIGAVAVLAARDDPKPDRVAAVETSVAPETTAARPAAVPTTRPAPPATTAHTEPPPTDAPTTTVAPTTTLLALPSGAGDYNITFGDITISGAGISTTVPGQTQLWSFVGACDGVGECAITAAGEAVLSTSAVGSIFSSGAAVTLVPAGNRGYTSTFTFGVEACGAGTGTISFTVADGAITGQYDATLLESGDCPAATISAPFSGSRA
jgi:hypothetical protein